MIFSRKRTTLCEFTLSNKYWLRTCLIRHGGLFAFRQLACSLSRQVRNVLDNGNLRHKNSVVAKLELCLLYKNMLWFFKRIYNQYPLKMHMFPTFYLLCTWFRENMILNDFNNPKPHGKVTDLPVSLFPKHLPQSLKTQGELIFSLF